MTDYAALSAAVDDFRTKRILCIGDVMLDRYVYGDVERISPEAPIPVLSIIHEEIMLGAAGNVAKNIAALGAIVEFYSATGDDKAGFEIKGLLDKEKNIISYLATNGKTTVKTRYISGNQHILRKDEDGKSIIEHPSEFKAIDAIIISDYGRGVTDDMIMADLKAIGVPVIVDSKSWFGLFRGATVITPNLGELAKNVDSFRQSGTHEEIVEAASDLIDLHKIENVLVTRASKGMTLISEDKSVHHIPAIAKEVYDVVGAGDTVAAVLALGLAVGLAMPDAAFIANIAGGIVVGKRGTAICTPQELKQSLLQLMESAV